MDYCERQEDMAKQTRGTRAAVALQADAPVVTDTGMTGTVTEVLHDFPDGEGGIRVAWNGGSSTVVPRRAIAVEPDRILVHTDAAHSGTVGSRDRVLTGDEEVTVPVVEERLTTETSWREAGTATVRVRTEDVPERVTAEITREELEVAEVVVERVLAEAEMPTSRQEGEVLVIPVIEERLVITKQRVLTKELHITKRTRTETQEVSETVQRQWVEIDAGDAAARVHPGGILPAREETHEGGGASPSS